MYVQCRRKFEETVCGIPGSDLNLEYFGIGLRDLFMMEDEVYPHGRLNPCPYHEILHDLPLHYYSYYWRYKYLRSTQPQRTGDLNCSIPLDIPQSGNGK